MTTTPEAGMRPPAYPLTVGQEIDLHGHRWTVKGIHLGALGQESLIHLEGLSHEPGWTGPWEFHPMLFVPEIMLSAALAAAPVPPAYKPLHEVDSRAVCEALGFDPTNHHNAAKCPYCTPAVPPAGGEGETGWLIESWNSKTGEFGATWWSLDDSLEDAQGWTKDSTIALRFAREADAQAYINDTAWTEAKPTEHRWHDALAARAQPPARDGGEA